MGFLDKLKKSQNAFDENWIMDHKEYWKKKFRNLSRNDMQAKLRKIEARSQFDSSKSSKRIFWMGGFGSAMHIKDRERESQRRALRELLGLKW